MRYHNIQRRPVCGRNGAVSKARPVSYTHLHLCILITAYYGLRRSEVLGLKWSSIDFERKSITINHKVTEQLVNGKYVPVVSDVMKNKTCLLYTSRCV